MKRLLLILPLLCLAAGDEIPGWKASTDEWKNEKGMLSVVLSTETASRIVTQDKFPEPSLSFLLCVPEWTEGGAVGVYWGMRGTAGADSYFRQAIDIRSSLVKIGKMEGEGKTSPIGQFTTQVPAGKWVPVSLTYKKGKLLIAVGQGRHVFSLEPTDAAGYMAINAHKLDFQIRKLKTK